VLILLSFLSLEAIDKGRPLASFIFSYQQPSDLRLSALRHSQLGLPALRIPRLRVLPVFLGVEDFRNPLGLVLIWGIIAIIFALPIILLLLFLVTEFSIWVAEKPSIPCRADTYSAHELLGQE